MASTASVAAGYSPLSGLITDNNYGQYVGNPKLGAAYSPSFNNPNAPTTGASGAPGAPGPITGAGAYTPDWQSLITGDAGLKDAAAALAAGGAQNEASLNSQLANAYESFGKNVDLSTLAKQLGMSEADIQSALGPDVQKLAQENTDAGLSTTARLDKANTDAVHQIMANLNKRGLLHSGETGYELDQQNLGYRQASSDAYQKLLGFLQQYQQGFLAAQQTNAGHLSDAYSSAADRVQAGNTGTSGVTANPDHQDSTGAWVYKGTDGNFYTADGKPYVAPQGPPPPTAAPPGVADILRLAGSRNNDYGSVGI